MDVRALQKAKDFVSSTLMVSPLGQGEELLTTAPEVTEQVGRIRAGTLVPMSEEAEVREGQTHTPKIITFPVDKGKSDKKSKEDHDTFYEHEKSQLTRRPNRWDTNCNLVVPTNVVIQAWLPKVNMDAVSVFNQSSSAGAIYIAPTQEKLLSNPIRGKKLNPGDEWEANLEAGAFLIAPNGATIDVVIAWYEDHE